MSAITKRIHGASRFLNEKFDPNRAADEASIKYITKIGQLSDRFLAMNEISISEEEVDEIDKFLNWSAATWESAMPYFRAQNDSFFALKIQAYLRLHKRFIYYKHRLNARINERDDAISLYENKPQLVLKRKIPLNARHVDSEIASIENLDEEEEREEETPINIYPDAETESDDLRLRTLIKALTSKIHAEVITGHIEGITNTINICRYDMLEVSKYMIAISFNKDDVEPAKTLVMNKPEMQARISGPPQMQTSQIVNQMQRDIRRISAHIEQTGRPPTQ